MQGTDKPFSVSVIFTCYHVIPVIQILRLLYLVQNCNMKFSRAGKLGMIWEWWGNGVI